MFSTRRKKADILKTDGLPDFQTALNATAQRFAPSGDPTLWVWPSDLASPATSAFLATAEGCIAELTEWSINETAELTNRKISAEKRKTLIEDVLKMTQKEVDQTDSSDLASEAKVIPDSSFRPPIVGRTLEFVLIGAVGVADLSVLSRVFLDLIPNETATNAYALAGSVSVLLLAGSFTLGRAFWRVVHRPKEKAPGHIADLLLSIALSLILPAVGTLLAIARTTTLKERDELIRFLVDPRQAVGATFIALQIAGILVTTITSYLSYRPVRSREKGFIGRALQRQTLKDQRKELERVSALLAQIDERVADVEKRVKARTARINANMALLVAAHQKHTNDAYGIGSHFEFDRTPS